MGRQRLPAAVYGKSNESRDQFVLLWNDHDFPDIAKQALDSLRSGFQFKGSKDSERYQPSYAIWPTKDDCGWIAARFLDAGTDSLGRPHTLRIEAVYLGVTDLADAALFLIPENWPSADTYLVPESATFEKSFQDQTLLAKLLQRANTHERPSVFRNFEDSSSHLGFQIVIDEHKKTIKVTEPESRKPQINQNKMSNPIPLPIRNHKRIPWYIPLAAGLIIGLLTAGIPGFYKLKEKEDQLSESYGEIEMLKSFKNSLEAEVSKITSLRKEDEEKSRKRVDELESNNETLRRERNNWVEYNTLLNYYKIGTPEQLNAKLEKWLPFNNVLNKFSYTDAEKHKQITDRIRQLLDELDRLKNPEKSKSGL